MCEQDKKIYDETNWRLRVFDSLSFPTLIIRPDETIMTANQVFLEKYNQSIDQIVGKKCHEVFYGEKVCPNEICPLKRVIKERKGQTITRRTRSRTGKQVWEDRVFSPILDADGNVDFIMESVRDVTRMKNLEMTLKEAEAFLEKVIYASPVAIVAADRYANVLLMNPVAEALFGYTKRQAITMVSVEELYPPGIAKSIMRQLRDKKRDGRGKLLHTETFIRNSKGEDIPVELNAAIIYEDDVEVATVGLYKDRRPMIAMEKKLNQANEQLIQSEKMASLGKLAAGVAHEINNPLTGIILYGSMALNRLKEDDSQGSDLKFILEDANRCKEIVKSLLAYSRQTSAAKEVFSINALVNESLALIRDQKLFMNINLHKALTPEELCVKADKNQMAQVIINLVMNAVDAMEQKGDLTLRTYREAESGQICLEVEDTGHGIPKEDVSRVFDPFFTTKDPGSGTGLGLSTVYGIVKETQGEVSIKKTGPEGTCFLIRLPECHSDAATLFF